MRSSTVRWSAAALALLLAGGPVPPAAAQWKWRDRSGQMQYSDRPPPPGTPDAAVLQRPPSAARLLPPLNPGAAGNMGTAGTAGMATGAAGAASAPGLAVPPSPRASEPELEARRRKAEQDEAARKKIDDERQAALRADHCSRARGQLRALDDGMRIARVNENGERVVLDDDARAAESQRVRAVLDADCR